MIKTNNEMNVRAMLLIGPTGVGKTPFGWYLETRGLGGGRRCLHFDFGHQLRAISGHGTTPDGFLREELSFIRDVLEKGLLLENEHFPIAEKIIEMFLRDRDFSKTDILVLNGLPRHTDQARDMDRTVKTEAVIVLDCEAEEVFRRIAENTGGDRSGRTDDNIEMVRRKLDIFHERTAPLIGHYAAAGCDVFRLKVTASSTVEDVYSDFISMTNRLRLRSPDL
ncbi:MAG: nucleoside monophosphate kinase [Nitrospiraceae bacterium]|nr:nucleoside monophosphate kinase [Nitrospiraceae bacterium]